MKLGFAFLTLTLVAPQATIAQTTTNPCANNASGLTYWCSGKGRCVANQYACTGTSTLTGTGTGLTANPCVSNTNGLTYWCSSQGKCVASISACTAGSTTTSANPCINNTNGMIYWCGIQGRCVANMSACTNPCVSNTNGLTYWCSTQGKCVANQSVCTAGSTTTTTTTTTTSSSQCNQDPNSNPYLPFWCESTQTCKPSSAYCKTGYTEFKGPMALKCQSGASCTATVATRSYCPNDNIYMGHYYWLKANGMYNIGSGCTVYCFLCVNSGTTPTTVGQFTSGTYTPPGYSSGTTGSTGSTGSTGTNTNNQDNKNKNHGGGGRKLRGA